MTPAKLPTTARLELNRPRGGFTTVCARAGARQLIINADHKAGQLIIAGATRSAPGLYVAEPSAPQLVAEVALANKGENPPAAGLAQPDHASRDLLIIMAISRAGPAGRPLVAVPYAGGAF